MKERAQELKAEARADKDRAEGEQALLAKIARDERAGRSMAKRLMRFIQASAADPVAKDLVWDARVCQGRQGRLLFPERAKVQFEVRDTGL